MPIAIDISNYTGAISLDRVERWKALGAKRVVVGLQFPLSLSYPPGIADRQLEALVVAGGLDIEVYFESTPIAVAWPLVARFAPYIKRAWLACETGSGYETGEDIRRGLATLEALALPRQAGIYTGAWWWVPNIGTEPFKDRPLWVANYDRKQDLRFSPFSGWTTAAMKQYTGDAISEDPGWGPAVDLNWYEEQAVMSPRPSLTNIYLAAFDMLGRRIEPIEADDRFNRATVYWPK